MGLEILRFSNLIGCFTGSGCEKNKLIKSLIKVVMEIYKIAQSKGYRKHNIQQKTKQIVTDLFQREK